MTWAEWQDCFLKTCQDFHFETDWFWGYVKVVTRTDIWYVAEHTRGQNGETGKIIVLHHNNNRQPHQRSVSQIPDTHIQFCKKIEPEKLVRYFYRHQKKYLIQKNEKYQNIT